MENLGKAQRVRIARAELRADWKSKGRTDACLDAAQLILEPPLYLMTARVEQFLGWLPSIGILKLERAGRHRSGFKIKKWLRELSIPMGTAVAQFTPRQRHALAARLRLYSDPVAWSDYLEHHRS